MQVSHKFRGSTLFMAAFSLLLSSFALSSQALAQSKLENIEAYIDGTIEAQMKLEDIPAVTVSVVENGELIFSKGYGYQDLEKRIPVSAEKSLFRIGSTSKLFTWTAVMQLHEQGRVDLDADVNDYLDFEIPATYDEPITLRHILGHTAGFEDGGLGYLIQYYPNKGPELAEAMAKYIPKRVNPPGEVSSYSNYATALAGLVVENVSGVPFNQYIVENIYEPLGMEYASFDEPLSDELNEHMVKGYTREMGKFAEQPFEMINSFGPAGAMAASADAMAKFMLAHLNNGEYNGQRILQEDTAKLMHSLLFAGDDRFTGMAYGFYQKTYNGHVVIGHGGDTMQFHTDMALDKEQNIGIFVSYMDTDSNAARNNFVGQIYDHYFDKPLEQIEPPSDFAERADQYAGNYTFWRRNVSTIEKAFGLMSGGIEVVPTEDNTLLVVGLYGPRQYVEIGEHLFRQVDGSERLAFSSRSGDGIDTMYFEGLPFMGIQRTPGFESSLFKWLIPGFSLLLFLQVIVSWFYRRKHYKTLEGPNRKLVYSSLWMSLVHFLFVVLIAVIAIGFADSLYSGIPTAMKLVLGLSVIAVLLSLVSAYFYVKRLQAGTASVASHIYYGVVVLAGLFLSYFYYYWNLLGWNYY
ncbi:serine hydrolase [Pseudidiomarina aestuarii]|uniref:Serine hydrolase n=1 Tax=Pseudidiomarina aestuarii TaxID=624146 RepID=A0A7Z6ZSC6_9GAMM|nr:serine hydrolase domain-containing protein [Pseudidiomarina aestuarii]RUO39440.1 serine hydrolase [Pseudidiomarina aestuarii]